MRSKRCQGVLFLSLLLAISGTAQALTYHSWDPYMATERYYVVNSSGLGPCMGSECLPCCPAAQAWRFSTTTEDYNYTNSNNDDVYWNHPIWTVNWNHQMPEDEYAINFAVDKYNYNYFRNKHVFAGINEAFDYIGTEIPVLYDGYIDFRCNLVEILGQDCGGDIGWSKMRAMLGVTVNWGGRDHYLEINLWRTDNYDNVTTTTNVDPSPPGWPWYDNSKGVYDRRACYPHADIVYYNGPEVDELPGCDASDEVAWLDWNSQQYHINISRIIRSTVWSDYPASWAGIKIHGMYLGVEVWGGGKMNIAFDDIAAYSY